jgi:hypothetical protein
MMDLRIEGEAFIRSGMRAEVAIYATIGGKLHSKGITLRKLRNVEHAEVSAASLLKDDKALKAWAKKALSVRQFAAWARGLNLTTWQNAGLSAAALIGSHKTAWTETGNVSDKGAQAIRIACTDGATLEQVKDALGIVKGEGRKVSVESIVRDAGKLDVQGVSTVTLTLASALPDDRLADTLKAIAAEVKRRKATVQPAAEVKAPEVAVA